MANGQCWRLGLASTALGLICLAVPPGASAMANPVSFDISAQPMPRALRQFATQAHLQLLFDYGALRGVKARHLHARMQPDDALATLLKGTGFAFQQVNARTYAIRSIATGSVAQSSSAMTSDKDGKEGKRHASTVFRLARVGRSSPAANAATVDAASASPQPMLAELKTVTVTGSRLITNATLSPTPITSVSAQQLQALNPGPLSQALRELPAMETMVTRNPGSTLEANINLRGIGSPRTLVLFDGQRAAPEGAPDTNLLPQMLVQRVDVVTGGASAVYGSDAVSGVVNYVINHDFNGLEVSAQRGESTYQDDKTWNAGLAAGTPLFNGRGHIEASVQFFKDPGIPDKFARSWGRGLWSMQGSVPGSTVAAGKAGNPYGLYANTRLSTSSFGGVINSGPLAGLQFAQNGVLSPFVNGAPTGSQGVQIGGDGAYYTDVAAYDGLNMGQGFGRFDYDFTDHTKGYVELAVGSADYSSINQHGTENVLLNNVAIGYNNAYLAGVTGIQPQYASTIAAQLAADPLSSFKFGKMTTPADNFAPPQDVQHESQKLLIAGLNGIWGRYKWSLAYEWLDEVTTNHETDTVSYPRLYAALNAVVDPATGQVVCNAALANPAAYGNCVPLNVFGPSASSQAAFNYIRTDAESWTKNGMSNVSGSIIGSPVSDWAGPIDMAVSGEWRRVTYGVTSDALPTTAVDCAGIQFNCSSKTSFYYYGATAAFPTKSEGVGELAYEAEIPVLKDAFLAKSLTFNGAARFTHYTTSGSVWTWKLGAVWRLDDAFRIRVTRSYDIRAPGLTDLYTPATLAVTGIADEHTGASGNVPVLTHGNPNLKPEKASTWTAGFVWSPKSFQGGKLSIDFYHINIGDALVTINPRQPATMAACEESGGTSSVCALYIRPHPYSDVGADNFPTELIDQELNVAQFTTYGVDSEFDYSHRIAGHNLRARLLLTYQPHLIYDQGPAGTIDVGGAADGVGGLPPTPSVVGVLSFNYEVTQDLSLRMQERYRNSMKQNGSALLYFATPPLAPIYYTDMTVSYDHGVGNGTLQLYLNIRNLFNRQPLPWASSGGGSQIGGLGGYAPVDDVIGRYFSLGLRYRIG